MLSIHTQVPKADVLGYTTSVVTILCSTLRACHDTRLAKG